MFGTHTNTLVLPLMERIEAALLLAFGSTTLGFEDRHGEE